MFIDTSEITRLEVIDSKGRRYLITNTSISVSVQDDDKTLKIYVNGNGITMEGLANDSKEDRRLY